MAQQIDQLGMTNLPLAIYCNHHVQTNSMIGAFGTEELHIVNQATAYSASVELLNSIVNRSTAYVSTSQLESADKLRDKALGVLMQVINAHKSSVIAAKEKAALALSAMIAPYKGIGDHERGAETREVAGLIAVLSTDEAQAHVTTLHLTEELEALIVKNAEFEIIMSGKVVEEANRTPQTEIKTEELRKQIDAQYAEIVQTVNAYAIVQPTETLTNFITQMNALITLTKRSAASVSKDTKEKDEPEKPATEGETTTEDANQEA